MKAIRRIAVAISTSLIFMLAGCGKRTQEGQVFITTQGGENVKLGSVEILAFDEESIRSHVKEKLAEIAHQRNQLQKELASAEADFQKIEEPYRKAMATNRNIQTRYDDHAEVLQREIKKVKESERKLEESRVQIDHYQVELLKADRRIASVLNDAKARAAIAQEEITRQEIFSRTNNDPAIVQANYDKADYQEQLARWLTKSNEIRKLLEKQQPLITSQQQQVEKIATELSGALEEVKAAKSFYQKAESRVIAAKRTLNDFRPDSILFAGLREPLARTATDAEGRFRFEFPSNERYAIVARGQRHVVGETENYIWLVWTTGKGQLLLNNANLLGSASTDQVVVNSF